MARIRTIKPEFFRHHDLYQAERESGLPLRVAFAGLWTACDREGRFRWRPAELKLDVLPYDEVDFTKVLDALVTRGFIVHYTCPTREDASQASAAGGGNSEFGAILSWKRHQIINNRETASNFPEYTPDKGISHASSTRTPRDTEMHVHAQAEGEGEREEENIRGVPPKKKTAAPTKDLPAVIPRTDLPAEMAQTFEAAKKTFEGSPKAKAIMYADPESTAREIRNLKILVKRSHKISPDDPAGFLAAAMRQYRCLVNGKLRGKAAWTPSGLVTTWIWQLVLEGLKAEPSVEERDLMEVVDGVYSEAAS